MVVERQGVPFGMIPFSEKCIFSVEYLIIAHFLAISCHFIPWTWTPVWWKNQRQDDLRHLLMTPSHPISSRDDFACSNSTGRWAQERRKAKDDFCCSKLGRCFSALPATAPLLMMSWALLKASNSWRLMSTKRWGQILGACAIENSDVSCC